MAKKIMTKEEFNKLPRKEQRILVAKDVLKQLKVGKYVAHAGSYISSIKTEKGWLNGFSNSGMLDKPVKENFNDIKECNVCALGSCILSATKFKNVLTFKDVTSIEGGYSDDDTPDRKLLKTLFTDRQMAMIEAFFEGDSCVYVQDIELSNEIMKASNRFRGHYEDDDKRLQLIMNNIIKNGGEFKWQQLMDKVPLDACYSCDDDEDDDFDDDYDY